MRLVRSYLRIGPEPWTCVERAPNPTALNAGLNIGVNAGGGNEWFCLTERMDSYDLETYGERIAAVCDRLYPANDSVKVICALIDDLAGPRNTFGVGRWNSTSWRNLLAFDLRIAGQIGIGATSIETPHPTFRFGCSAGNCGRRRRTKLRFRNRRCSHRAGKPWAAKRFWTRKPAG